MNRALDRLRRPVNPVNLPKEEPKPVPAEFDFGNMTSVDQVMQAFAKLKALANSLRAEDGTRLPATGLARKLDQLVNQVREAQLPDEMSGQAKVPTPQEIQAMLQASGLHRVADLKQPLTRLLSQPLELGAEYYKARNEILGAPEDRPERPPQEEKVKVRPERTEAERQQERQWQDARRRVVFDPSWINEPKTPNQEPIPEVNEGVATFVQHALAPNGVDFIYEGVNWIKKGNEKPEPRLARTLVIPIDHMQGHSITLTLLSGVDLNPGEIAERAQDFSGVVVESVDEISVLAGKKVENGKSRRIVEAAIKQMAAAEQKVRAQLGVDLGIEQKLQKLLA